MRTQLQSSVNLFFGLLLILGGCCCGDNVDCEKCPDHADCVIPADYSPTIVVLNPSSMQTLNFRDDVVQLSFRLDDDWQLDSFWLKETWVTVTGTEYVKFGEVSNEKVLSGTNFIQNISYTVPDSQIQSYSKIKLTGYVRDNKGQVASKTICVNVLPEPGMDDPPYDIQDEPGCNHQIHSILSGTKYNYWFYGVTNEPTSSLMYDVGEASVSPNFTAILETPNQPGVDSTIVMVDAATFNYDSLTWKTTWEAFVTSNKIGAKSESLMPGDIVIVKLISPPHYAVMRICDTKNNVISFEYKFSHD